MASNRTRKAAFLGVLLGVLLGWIPAVVLMLPLALLAGFAGLLTGTAVGFWVAIVLVLLGWIGVIVLAGCAAVAQRATDPRSFACEKCGYNLLGTRSSGCPECGKAIGLPQRQFLDDQQRLLDVVSRLDETK